MAVNLRDKPIDRRRLSMEDRQTYRPGQRTQKVARARARKGYMAQLENMPKNTTDRKPGTGGFTKGITLAAGSCTGEGCRAEEIKSS